MSLRGRRGLAQLARDLAHLFAVIARHHDGGEAAERRRGDAFAIDPLLLVKTVAVAFRQRLHHRVGGIAGLQQHQARLFGTPGAARNLVQQLKRPLARPQIAISAAQIGIDHPHQGQLRENDDPWR